MMKTAWRFLRAAGKTAAGIFFILSVMLSAAGAGWSLLKGDNVAVCFFLAAAVVFSYSLFLLFSACEGWQKALSPTVAAVLFAGGLAVGGNGGLSEIEDWCYDMGVCIGGLISEEDCLAHGGKWTAADGGACYMNWSVVKPNSAE
jgi:hypothetical protein